MIALMNKKSNNIIVKNQHQVKANPIAHRKRVETPLSKAFTYTKNARSRKGWLVDQLLNRTFA